MEKNMKKILFLLLSLGLLSFEAQGDISWSSTMAISTPMTDATSPSVVIDVNGNATAIWLESGIVKASSLPFDGSWSTPVSLSSSLNTSNDPRLGIDSNGNVTALWVENTLIKSASLTFEGGWSGSTTLSGVGADSPALAVDSNGHAVAVWTRSGFIESSTRISGIWSFVAVLSLTGSSNPTVAISDFGTAMAAWHATSAGSDVIVTDTLTISTNTWGVKKNVFPASAAYSNNYPKIAMDSNGNASIAWFRYNFQNNAYQNVQVLTSTLPVTSSSWASETAFPEVGIRNPADLTIKLNYDGSGNLLAVWTNSFDGESFIIESARKLLAGSWSLPVQPQVSTIYSFGIDVAIDTGIALLTNMAWDDISTLFITSQKTDTKNPALHAWTATTTFSSGNENGYPKCALSTLGSNLNAVAVWVNNNGTNNVINAATGSDTIVAPPTSVTASQSVTDLGLYLDYQNTVTWSASPDPDLIQYDIYRNGIFFMSVDSSTLKIVDHNAIQGGKVVYGVAALTSAFFESAIINYTLFP
jgi:hypothetical protein